MIELGLIEKLVRILRLVYDEDYSPSEPQIFRTKFGRYRKLERLVVIPHESRFLAVFSQLRRSTRLIYQVLTQFSEGFRDGQLYLCPSLALFLEHLHLKIGSETTLTTILG